MARNARLTRPANEILKGMDLGRSATPSDANEMGRSSSNVTEQTRRGADEGILVVPTDSPLRLEN